MVITNLQEKENKKFYVPIRGGNRGGWSLFKWDDVRDMPYKERQLYLGNSAVIGVLDRGGKWRKKDWYLKAEKKYLDKDLGSGIQQARKRDQQRMNAALGIASQQKDQQALTQNEMKQLLKRIKNKGQDYVEVSNSEKTIGLGFDKTKVEIRAKPSIRNQNPHRLEAIEQQGVKAQKLQKSQSQGSYIKQKKIKKQKKDKKHKEKQRKHKDQEHKRKHKRDRSRSKDRSQKKHKERKRVSSDSQ